MNVPTARFRHLGVGLIDVLIAMALTSFLLVSVVQLVVASSGSYRLQRNLGGMQQDARFAFDALRDDITQAGYVPAPWLEAERALALTAETRDSHNGFGDQLGLTRQSDRNCFGNANPTTDADGRPEFFLLESRYRVSTQGNLAWTCRYGAEADSLVIQVNGFGLVESVESFQLLFAEDQDGDGSADRWVNAEQWQDETGVIAVQIGLLLASADAVTGTPDPGNINVLDQDIATPADGHLRKSLTLTAAIRGRLR